MPVTMPGTEKVAENKRGAAGEITETSNVMRHTS